MRNKILIFPIFLILCSNYGAADISSLSQIFLLGKGIQDLDGDKIGEKVSLHIIIPDNPTAYELAAAGDIAARANLESLVVDFSVVIKESEANQIENLKNPILIGSNLNWAKKLEKEKKMNLPQLQIHQGFVSLISYKGQLGVALLAGSDEALLQTGRSFFLRWPYFWEIWGRKEGATYFSLEKDLMRFLKEKGTEPEKITIKSAFYQFPKKKTFSNALKRLKFNSGEIKRLVVEIDFSEKSQKEKTFQAIEALRLLHQKGIKTDILSYSGCASIIFELRHTSEISKISLDRVGFPKRILTPSYKPVLKPKITGKNFDLSSLFTTKGFYSATDNDKILDGLDTLLIIPHDSSLIGTCPLASRLVMNSTGASFPIIYLDKEIENRKALVAPILIGQRNSLIKELIKKGKLKIPPLKKSWALAKVIPEALNKSNALAIVGADNFGLDKILIYLSQTFPYFEKFENGKPRINDLPSDLEEFFKGKKGSAEAYFQQKIEKIIEYRKGEGRDFEYFKAVLYLPQENKKYEKSLHNLIMDSIPTKHIEIDSLSLNKSKTIFETEKEFPWEGNEALKLIQEKINLIENSDSLLNINLGVSESPKIREKIKLQIENLLLQNKLKKFEVKVLSAYKQGFFWLLEDVLPSLKGKNISRIIIRFAREKEDLSKPKRFYTEPYRWLQELYPVDEIISRETDLPLEKIEFEMKEDSSPVYEVLVFDEKNKPFMQKAFSPRIREALFLKALPEWGKVKLTTGWVKIKKEKETLLDASLMCDLERFWDYYQEKILAEVYSFILRSTENEPTFGKQPFFKRLLVEMWFSEPDFRLELDEELISSLESIHDELYFDTLDFLRGITDVKIEEEESDQDTSRHSAPGNILPLVHPSQEGGKGKIRVRLEDWQARLPQLHIRWKEKGQKEYHKKFVFPSIKIKSLSIPSFVYNGEEEKIENLIVEIEVEKETHYLALINLLDSHRKLWAQKIISSFDYPKLKTITLQIKFKDLVKEEPLFISSSMIDEKTRTSTLGKDELIVPTDQIISHQMCLDIVHRLSLFKPIRSYIAGKSYENRKIPVLEIFTPLEKYVSLPRLITFKPTLFLNARQHANEVSATNYVLKLAEHLAKDEAYQEYTKKINFVINPMENPDGADLAYELQKLTPFHSLHAGRYTSLGMDIGYQVKASKPILPEAKIRKILYSKWLPDIYLSLHGYPSHEWVQQFSNYSPYLYRDYWIPRGWFVYFRSLSLPIYQKWKKAGEELMAFIIKEMRSNKRIDASNQKFYNRYYRWASRWQPHMDYLELHNGVNLYAKRHSSREQKLSARRQITFAEETPELMDETAQGEWLNFLCEHGLAYLKAHLKYLSQAKFECERIEEEIQDRIHIHFYRSRPGKVTKETNKTP